MIYTIEQYTSHLHFNKTFKSYWWFRAVYEHGICSHVSQRVHSCTWIQRSQDIKEQVLCSVTIHLVPRDRDFLWTWSSWHLGKPGGQQTLGTLLFLLTHSPGVLSVWKPHPAFYVGFGDLNPGFHACIAPSEPFSQYFFIRIPKFNLLKYHLFQWNF